MSPDELDAEYAAAFDEFDLADEGSRRFHNALARMEALADRGSVGAAETIAEFYCLSGRYHDAERAYRRYFRALAVQG